jgi:hypothetical protein
MKIFKISPNQIKPILKFNRLFFTTNNNLKNSPPYHQKISEMDNQSVSNIMLSPNNSYSEADYSHFLRILNLNKRNNNELLQKFASSAQTHINTLDELDLRKVISIIIASPSLQKDENLIRLVKERYTQLKGKTSEDIFHTFNMQHYPMSVKFWVYFAKRREGFLKFLRGLGVNLQ